MMNWMRTKQVEVILTLMLMILMQALILGVVLSDYRQTVYIEIAYVAMDWESFPKKTRQDKQDEIQYLSPKLEESEIFNQPGGGMLSFVNR
jgi:hypothetical protein